jgi:tetratricopeptide (TPR) repeat protein
MPVGNESDFSADCENCYTFLEYVQTRVNLEDHGFTIIDCYEELGDAFLQHNRNVERAIACFKRMIDVGQCIRGDRDIGFGAAYMRLADALGAAGCIEEALSNYEWAIDQFSRIEDILGGKVANLDIAVCWCQIALYQTDKQVAGDAFERAFGLLLLVDHRYYISDACKIAVCFLCLAKSCAQFGLSLALEIVELSLRLFLNDGPLPIDYDIGNCCDLLLKLSKEKKSGEFA